MRTSSLFALALGLACTASTAVLADVPNPACSHTTLDRTGRLLMIPGTEGFSVADFSVTILGRDCSPIPRAIVEVDIAGLREGRTRLCDATSLVQTTNARGEAFFSIRGGGCAKGPRSVVIRANGVVVRDFQAAVSPDYTGYDNEGVAGRSDLGVNARDLAAFSAAYRLGGPSCHDYDNDRRTGAADLAVFMQAYRAGAACRP